MSKQQQKGMSGHHVTLRKIKGRKKQSEKDLGFLRIGSLNVRVKKTTEAFSNFLGVGSGSAATVNPSDCSDKILKGWGSADNLNKEMMTAASKNGGGNSKKKSKSMSKHEVGRYSSTPNTPRTPNRTFNSVHGNESDSDSAAGFDSHWKH
ncbi:unnamed protein product [Acanthoscelides obtectus]|uniref:Uncharacterized protein n=1 Tax=Acanthoscelides obtectus TaxID=200917 RepID=A0A9P0KP20_ACAOB|nr:unnamed protein product [Acanthoscelides obtectus]CAK1652631.1 hypothetical protein AOBTE_LOCUS17873 [Acanthoscelides obtectus]